MLVNLYENDGQPSVYRIETCRHRGLAGVRRRVVGVFVLEARLCTPVQAGSVDDATLSPTSVPLGKTGSASALDVGRCMERARLCLLEVGERGRQSCARDQRLLLLGKLSRHQADLGPHAIIKQRLLGALAFEV